MLFDVLNCFLFSHLWEHSLDNIVNIILDLILVWRLTLKLDSCSNITSFTNIYIFMKISWKKLLNMSNFTCSWLLCTDITYNIGHFTSYVQYTARIIHIALCVYSLIMTKTLFFNQNYGFKSSSFVYLVCTCIYNMDRSISCLCFPSCLVLIFNIRPW